MLRLLACAALLAPASAWWKDGAVRERGEPPYPYPASHADGTGSGPSVRTNQSVDGVKLDHVRIDLGVKRG